MKRLLFYFNSMTPAGGIERVIATLANKLTPFFDITILVKDEAKSHYPLNEKIHLISLNTALNFDMSNRVQRVVEAGRNIVASSIALKKFLQKVPQYDYFYIAHPLNALELFIARGVDQSVIVTEHGGVDAYNFIYKTLKKALYRKAKCYVVPTKTDTEFYCQEGYNAIYVPHFKSQLDYSKQPLNTRIALTIGRVTEAKRQWILIDLWDRLVHTYKITDWKLYIVGEGNLTNNYLQKIRELDLEEFVFILPPRKDVEYYYKQASLFLLTSSSEGFGMVLLEAISFGIPVITYDCPSGPRDVINKTNGFLVPLDNFNQLVESTLQVIRDDSLLINLGEGAFRESTNWSDDKVLEQWQKILR